MEMNKESLQSCDTHTHTQKKVLGVGGGGWFSVQMDEKLASVSISQRHPEDICSTSERAQMDGASKETQKSA